MVVPNNINLVPVDLAVPGVLDLTEDLVITADPEALEALVALEDLMAALVVPVVLATTAVLDLEDITAAPVVLVALDSEVPREAQVALAALAAITVDLEVLEALEDLMVVPVVPVALTAVLAVLEAALVVYV